MIIEAKGIEKSFGALKVLKGVDFQVDRGEVVAIIGPSGSGKSTFMKSLYGDLPIAAGRAQVLDYDMTKIRRRKLPYLRRRIGIVFQDYQLLTDRSVEENLTFVLRATGWRNRRIMKDHVLEILKQVNMDKKAYKMPYQLSGGEQQRVVIARALLNSPEIILADEPTGNLDPETGAEIMELLYSIRQSGISVVLSTHNVLWPERYPGRRLLFDGGLISEGK